jgi:cyclomaltodextrinase
MVSGRPVVESPRLEDPAGEPAWVSHAVWWQVFPLGFVGAEPTAVATGPVSRLGRVVDWLDYAVDLGASGIALGPIFSASTHGYDTLDHYRIDDRLGTDADFDRLVEALRARGLRLLLDGVFNHVSPGFTQFRGGAGWLQPIDPAAEGRSSGPAFRTFEGHEGLLTLDHSQPAVADYVVDVMRHWLGRGADGWRLDAAYAVPREFWSTVLPRVRASYPHAYLVGEVIHGDYAGIVAESRMDSVTQYELWKAIWSSIRDRNLFELSWAMERHNALLDHFVPLTFIGNHDVTRLATVLPDDRHLVHALVILCTVGGTPSIYYGDEQAFRGVKEARVGGDDAIRPPFPAEGPGALAPYGWPVYRAHQQLIGLRRRHPWLHRARSRPLQLGNRALAYESVGGTDRLVSALNLDEVAVRLPAPGCTQVLAGDAELHRSGSPDATVTVPSHGWVIVG